MSIKHFVRDRFSAPSDVGLDFTNVVSATQQHHAPDCDVHNILRKYSNTSTPLPTSLVPPTVVSDFDVRTLAESVEYLNDFEDYFNKLPPVERAKYADDFDIYLDFVLSQPKDDAKAESKVENPKKDDVKSTTPPSETAEVKV